MNAGALDLGGRAEARWNLRHPRLAAVLIALVPVLGTGIGFGVAQANGASEAAGYAAAAAGATVAAVIGLLTMGRARPSLTEFGFRSPAGLAAVLWCLPLLLDPVVVLATGGVRVPAAQVGVLAWLALAAAVNEEVWFRGLVLAALRGRGARYAVVFTSVLFAVLHLSNLAGGASPSYAVLQLVFAALFGFVAAELAVLTGSLWPVICWHFAHDFASYLTGDATTTATLAGLGVVSLVTVGYAALLWRRLS